MYNALCQMSLNINSEQVGKERVYETASKNQNSSLKWLISELIDTLKISSNEIYRHPDVGRRTKTEARTVKILK